MTDSELFDRKRDEFLANQETPWGKLRYSVAAANLRRHLPAGPLDILDAGGGNGAEAIAFARQGHRVALVDFSKGMLESARASAERLGLGGILELHRGDVADIPQLFPGGRFDAALCHNVLQYVADPERALRAVGRVVRPGGILSIICINRYSEPFRLALQELDFAAARAALGARTIAGKLFDAPMTAFAEEDFDEPLRQAGFSVAGRYGIRCIIDYIPDNDLKRNPETFAAIEQLELAMSAAFPYRLLARSFHLVAVKDRTPPADRIP